MPINTHYYHVFFVPTSGYAFTLSVFSQSCFYISCTVGFLFMAYQNTAGAVRCFKNQYDLILHGKPRTWNYSKPFQIKRRAL